ncbi:MAG: MBL fold metallo-hydrolase [Verrucomicrobiales bacterium]|nr:MBL fold metallo-hydrolase [Verrucomicrobiota bacterium JB025]
MKLSSYTGGMVETNAYLVETPDGNVLIDAPEGVADWLERKGVRVDEVLLTHQHYDHVMDAARMKDAGATLRAFADYSPELTLEVSARAWGMPIGVKPYEVDAKIDVERALVVCGLSFGVAHVPGHATDGLTFYLADAGVLFSGDTLFAGSIGRTDLPGGDTQRLLDGIDKHIMTLPPETRVLSGHGPATTVGDEAKRNPYLA